MAILTRLEPIRFAVFPQCLLLHISKVSISSMGLLLTVFPYMFFVFGINVMKISTFPGQAHVLAWISAFQEPF